MIDTLQTPLAQSHKTPKCQNDQAPKIFVDTLKYGFHFQTPSKVKPINRALAIVRTSAGLQVLLAVHLYPLALQCAIAC